MQGERPAERLRIQATEPVPRKERATPFPRRRGQRATKCSHTRAHSSEEPRNQPEVPQQKPPRKARHRVPRCPTRHRSSASQGATCPVTPTMHRPAPPRQKRAQRFSRNAQRCGESRHRLPTARQARRAAWNMLSRMLRGRLHAPCACERQARHPYSRTARLFPWIPPRLDTKKAALNRRLFKFRWCPQRESNSCLSLERAAS